MNTFQNGLENTRTMASSAKLLLNQQSIFRYLKSSESLNFFGILNGWDMGDKGGKIDTFCKSQKYT